jgi:hypothetical protein
MGLAGCVGVLLTLGIATLAGAQAPNARAVLPGYDSPILLDTLGISRPMTGSRDSIFVALDAIFSDLKIPVETRDPKAGLLHNLNSQFSRRLGGVSLSRYLDCGRGFNGNNADVYRITLAISAWVEPGTGDPQRLHVAIAASGRDPGGNNTGHSPCTSKGTLEELITSRVRARVSAS